MRKTPRQADRQLTNDSSDPVSADRADTTSTSTPLSVTSLGGDGETSQRSEILQSHLDGGLSGSVGRRKESLDVGRSSEGFIEVTVRYPIPKPR